VYTSGIIGPHTIWHCLHPVMLEVYTAAPTHVPCKMFCMHAVLGCAWKLQCTLLVSLGASSDNAKLCVRTNNARSVQTRGITKNHVYTSGITTLECRPPHKLSSPRSLFVCLCTLGMLILFGTSSCR